MLTCGFKIIINVGISFTFLISAAEDSILDKVLMRIRRALAQLNAYFSN